MRKHSTKMRQKKHSSKINNNGNASFKKFGQLKIIISLATRCKHSNKNKMEEQLVKIYKDNALCNKLRKPKIIMSITS